MPTVIITGAGTGIGASTALHLDRTGWRVFAGVHDPADGEVLAKGGSDRMMVAPLDVTDLASIKGFVAKVDDQLGGEGLTALVNNAGEGVAGPLESLPVDRLRHQFEVNVVGQVAMTQQVLPLLRRERERPRIVFVGSIGGLVAVQFAGAYHASKYAIEAIGDAWRQELAPDGISVVLLEPGPVSTPIWAKAAHALDSLPVAERYRERVDAFQETLRKQGKNSASPHSVAELIAKALTAEHPHTRYAGGLAATVVPKVRRLVPDRVFDKLAQRATK
ncbi:SDR family NAD(P)-dependent oxidoreductase [Kribbella deserti]|uniref:SDR family NAD(P)-dependent oxidoreductase n=1 Tax=Kribbella deserti TaxID=1926257 RepID=A0ABV6QIZ1_9ACTN